jgi:uncharacterized membrane protein YozB (DUF420 family)
VDPKLVYWSLALLNMAAIVALAGNGVLAIRRGEVQRHRRSMTAAAWLVALFLASYVVKSFALGSEALARWSPAARLNLWVHESFVTAMLLFGAAALVLGRRLARTRRVTGRDADPAPGPARLRRHRRLGWVAVGCAAFGLLTACGILAGMFARAS